VKSVSMGEAHMIIHCSVAGPAEKVLGLISTGRRGPTKEMLFGMGDNKWGQLGFNPFEHRAVKKLTPLNVNVLSQFQSPFKTI